MTTTLFKNARIITPQRVIERGWLITANGRIQSLGEGDVSFNANQIIDAGQQWLMPGFIDIHVHGGANFDTMDATPEALQQMARFFAQNGVTSFLPTTWTDTPERILAAMQNVANLQHQPIDGASILGVHMEGPYLNVAYCGAQNPDYIRHADRDEMAQLWALDVIRLIALAPEFPENHWLIQEASQWGVAVSIAHSAATYDEAIQSFQLGMSQTTHTFNAMTPLHHRNPGIVGAVMSTPHIYAELIADLIHVHPAAIQALWRAKGPDHVVLITDAIRASGMPEGAYQVDDRIMYVKDGACRLESGALAGSIIKINDAVRNFIEAVGTSLVDAWQVATLNPACAIRVQHRKGSIEINKDADLILVDADINVSLTMVEGRVVYQKEA